MNSVTISGRLLSLPFFIASVINPLVMAESLPSVTASTIFFLISGLITGLLRRFTKSRLLLLTACSHCISANTFSSSPFSLARSISDFAYRAAKRGLGIIKFFDCRELIQFYFINQSLDMGFLGILVIKFPSQDLFTYFNYQFAYLVLHFS